MSTSEKKQLTLKTSDGQEFVVEESAAVLSETIKNMVEDDCASTTIPIPNVDGKTMAKIIVYCKKHSKESDAERLKSFDAQFMKENNDQADLFDLILAANFLNIKGLVDLVAQTVADIIKGCKTPEAIRERLKIKNDFTPEEEEEIRKENTWALE